MSGHPRSLQVEVDAAGRGAEKVAGVGGQGQDLLFQILLILVAGPGRNRCFLVALMVIIIKVRIFVLTRVKNKVVIFVFIK
jgi:hypothetical protein